MVYRAIICCFLVLGVAEARVDFNHSKIFDEYDFYGVSTVTVEGLCTDTCHVFASITEASRILANNILIQTAKGFTSIATLADQRNSTNGQKLSLEIGNTPTLKIVNGNSGLAAGPLVLNIVNKRAPNFANAEVYEADGFLRRSSLLVRALTVMSARPFTLRQAQLEGSAGASPQGVIAHLTGFDDLDKDSDACPDLYHLTYAPFPGFTMEIKAPIVSLLYDLNQFSVPAGELSATIGITNVLQLQRSGFFNSPGFHGCAGKQLYRSSLYDYLAPSRVDLANATPQNISLEVDVTADQKHAVMISDATSGATNGVFGTSEMLPVTLLYFSNNLIVNWAQDGIMDYHYMIRYTSTIVSASIE